MNESAPLLIPPKSSNKVVAKRGKSSPNPKTLTFLSPANASMEHGDFASRSDVRKKQKTEKEQIPTKEEAEKEQKRLRDLAKLFIRNPRLSPRSFINPFFGVSSSQLEKQVLNIHKERKDKVKKYLQGFDGKLTISYDLVTHDDEWYNHSNYYIGRHGPHKDFVCMSVHFDHTFKVGKLILGYYPIEFKRGEKVSLYRIKNVLVDYEIENKVSSLLVSNYSDLGHKKFYGFRKWVEKRGKNQIDPYFFRIYCCADLFRLMAGDVFDGMDLLLEEIRVLVGWGKLTSTNWNVSLGNLQGALDMEDKKVFTEDEYYEGYDLPSDEEWIMIRTFCKLAGCIYKVAKELFEGWYSTSNVYFYLLAELKYMLKEELKNGDNDYFLSKAKDILERFDKYWNDMFLVLATASVLDPRFKMKYLEFYCSKNEVDEEGSKAETVLDNLRNLYARYSSASGVPTETKSLDGKADSVFYSSDEEEESEEEDSDEEDWQVESGEECGEEEEEEEEDDEESWEEDGDEECGEEEGEEKEHKEKEEKKTGAYKDFAFFQEFLKFKGSSREFGESELDSYLKEPVMEWNKDFQALAWWKQESQKYPLLSRVARDILSIPISRATWYEAYVADRRECPEFVVSMKPKLVNAIMCCKSWSQL